MVGKGKPPYSRQPCGESAQKVSKERPSEEPVTDVLYTSAVSYDVRMALYTQRRTLDLYCRYSSPKTRSR